MRPLVRPPWGPFALLSAALLASASTAGAQEPAGPAPAGPEPLLARARDCATVLDLACLAEARDELVHRFPAHEAAPGWAQEAVRTWAALGELARATRAVERFERLYGDQLPEPSAALRAEAGGWLLARGEEGEALRSDQALLRDAGSQLSAEQRVLVHSRIGRVWRARGETERARRSFAEVVSLWDGPDGRALRTDAGRLGPLRDLVAQGLFERAEAEHDQLAAIPFPALRGRRLTLDKMNRWARADLMPWIQRRMNAMAVTAAAYDRVSEPGATRFRVAAATRVGEMWLGFADEFQSAPTPAELTRDPQLLAVYRDALEDQMRAVRERGIAALEAALSMAHAHRFYGRWAREAANRLTAFDPTRFPAVDELLGPSLSPPALGVAPGPSTSAEHGPPTDDLVPADEVVEVEAGAGEAGMVR